MNTVVLEFLTDDAVLNVIERVGRASEFDKMLVPRRVDKDFITAQVFDTFYWVAPDDTLHSEGIIGINPVGKLVGFGPAFTR